MASAFVTVPKAFTLSKPNVPSVSTQRLFGLPRNSLRINAVALKWEPTKVVPHAYRVLIRLEQLPEKSPGGVLLPKSAVNYERYLMGEILSIGYEVGHVEPGNKVIFSDTNADEVDLGAETKHCFCKESDLLATVE